MTIRCVTLDWGDTLVTNVGNPYRKSLERSLAVLARKGQALGCAIPTDWVEESAERIDQHWSSSGKAEDGSEIVAMDSLGAALNTWSGLHLGWRDPRLNNALAEFFASFTQVLQPYDGVVGMLQQLKQQGLRVGILSHVPWPATYCQAWFERRGWHHYLDFFSFSSAVGFIKPHPQHFQHALALANVSAASILHVGDHPLRDVQGARAQGFRSCLRRTENLHPSALLDGCAPDAEILHVCELPELVRDARWS